ncbi:MAG: SDR family NAD(P)-dependent oxidoreductase [Thermoanaerobaculaceae bacterium]|nr:SDR family NAD(P)-dependent oxidoreductase [Thermoanaerobaculaceae bacterium]
MSVLTGKHVLVTGASSGIGAACAEAFAREGAHVVMAARRRDRLDTLAARLEQEYGVTVTAHTLDVRDREAVAALAEVVTERWGALDVLVNNAGLARGVAPLQEGRLEDWEEMIDANLKGLLYVTRAFLPPMVAARRGHVINIGSIAGHETYPGGNVYCATKHGVAALTRGLAMDLLGTGVRVSSVDPGLVETEFSRVRYRGDEERARAVYRGLEPLTAADVAEAVLFCATRPPHANVRELILVPTAQASVAHVFRNPS